MMEKGRFYQDVFDLRPWYHDFSRLGLQTTFQRSLAGRAADLARAALRTLRGGPVEKGEKLSLRGLLRPSSSHLVNQRHKEEFIIPFLQQALNELGEEPSCLDLFCADGYYSCTIARLRPDARITGIDLDPQEIRRAETAARILSASRARFVVADVWEWVQKAQPYDLVLCTGGLYHLREPRRFLELLRPISRRFLIVQSAVTLETDDPAYFVSPAPGWKHGSRFTAAGLRQWLTGLGWEIVAEGRNELTGNPRLCDRGSAYFLCRQGQDQATPEKGPR